MNSFKDIEQLWKMVPAKRVVPNAASVIAKARAGSRQMRNKILMQVIGLLLIIPVGSYLLFAINFYYSSTYIGLAIMLLAILLFSYFRLKQVYFLHKADFSKPPALLLKNFESFYQTQFWLNTTGAKWYSLLLNAGFGFYFYETLYMAPLSFSIKGAILLLYIAWVLLLLLWLHKRYVKKEHKSTGAIIERLKEISNTPN